MKRNEYPQCIPPMYKSLHYWNVETTLEKFVEDNIRIFGKQERSDIEKAFPYPSLHRVIKPSIPFEIEIDEDTHELTYRGYTFVYPEGTTHFKLDLFGFGGVSDNLNNVRNNLPTPLNITRNLLPTNNVDDPECQWCVYKEERDYGSSFGFFWMYLDKGTRVTDDVFSIEYLKRFNKMTHEPPLRTVMSLLLEHFDDTLIGALLQDNMELESLFEHKHPITKLIQYFDLNRVYREEEHVGDYEIQNKHKLLSYVINDSEFKDAYRMFTKEGALTKFNNLVEMFKASKYGEFVKVEQTEIYDCCSIHTDNLVVSFCSPHDEDSRYSSHVSLNGRICFDNLSEFSTWGKNINNPLYFPTNEDDFNIIIKHLEFIESDEYVTQLNCEISDTEFESWWESKHIDIQHLMDFSQ